MRQPSPFPQVHDVYESKGIIVFKETENLCIVSISLTVVFNALRNNAGLPETEPVLKIVLLLFGS